MVPVEIVLVINGLTFKRSYDAGYSVDDINNDVKATVDFMALEERLYIDGEMSEAPGYEKKSGD